LAVVPLAVFFPAVFLLAVLFFAVFLLAMISSLPLSRHPLSGEEGRKGVWMIPPLRGG
jgi:hypothetical protein